MASKVELELIASTQKAMADLSAFSKSIEASFKRFEQLLNIKIEADTSDAASELSDFHKDVGAMFEEIAEGPDADFSALQKELAEIDKQVIDVTKDNEEFQKSFSPLRAAAAAFSDNFSKRFSGVTSAIGTAFTRTKDFAKEVATRLRSSLDRAARSMKDFGSRVTRGFKSLLDSLFSVKSLIVGIAGFVVARKMINGISGFTDAAAASEDAVNRLNSSLRLAGDYSKDASSDMQAFAAQMQRTTTVAADQALELMSLAKSYGATNEQAKAMTQAAADLSVETGKSIEESLRRLGRSLKGSVGDLGNLGKGFRQLTEDQLKAGAAIDLTIQRFGGSAEAAAQTFSGARTQLATAFGDIKTALGQIITDNPVVIELMQSLKSAFEDLAATITANQDSVRSFVNDIIREVIDLTPNAVRILGGLGKGFISIARAILAASRNAMDFYRFIVDGGDSVADALKLISNPINAIVIGLTAVKQVGLENALSKQEAEAKKLNLQLFQLRKHWEQGRISQEEFHDAARDVRDQMIENRDEVSRLTSELKILQDVGQMAAIEIEADTEEFKRKLQEAAQTALKTEDILVRAELGIDAATEALATRLEGVAAAVKAAPNSKGTGAGGPSSPQSELPWFEKFSNFISENTPDWVSDIGSAFSEFGDAVSKATPGWVKEMGGSILGSIGKNIGGGVKGGQAVVGDTIGAGITAMGIPGGEMIGGLATQLAGATKEEAKQMAKDFAKGITEGVIALAENAPIFVEALAENAGPIITALVAAGPKLSMALIAESPKIAMSLITQLVEGIRYQLGKLGEVFTNLGAGFSEGFHKVSQNLIKAVTNFPDAFGRQMPKAVKEFTSAISTAFMDALTEGGAIVKRIGDSFIEAAKEFVNTLIEKAKDIVRAITPGGGGGGYLNQVGGKVSAGWKNLVGGATGGLVGGTGNMDTELFRLMPGELIVDKQRTARLDKAIENIEGGGNDEIVALLARILAALSSPQTVQSEVRLNERVLADIILQLNKANARLTA